MTATHPPASAPSRSSPPAAAAPSAPTVRKFTFAPRVIRPACPRLLIYGVEGVGKTSIGASAPEPLILMSKGERGYDTLLSANRVNQVPAEEVTDWKMLLDIIDSLITDPQGRKSIVFDVIGGFDRMAQEVVCRRDFGGDWSNPRDGFMAFGGDRGLKLVAQEWLKVFSKLDQLVDKHNIMPIMLAHAKVIAFKNPLGSDYDRYEPDISKHAMSEAVKWSDAVLLFKFMTATKDGASKMAKAKGIGGTDRVLYTEQCDAFTAKNRYGMPPELDFSKVSCDDTFSTIFGYIAPAK